MDKLSRVFEDLMRISAGLPPMPYDEYSLCDLMEEWLDLVQDVRESRFEEETCDFFREEKYQVRMAIEKKLTQRLA